MRKIQKPIRVLHIVGIMNMGGIENLLMNIYRNIDREEIQFDFLVTREEKGIFDDEIKSLGGNIYNIPHMSSVGVLKYKKILFEFFKEHKEFEIVHCHRDALCSIYLKQAKKAGITNRIAHSHTTKLIASRTVKGSISLLIKKYFKIFINRYATHYFACGEKAGKWLFGSNVANNKLRIVNNGIKLEEYIYSDNIAEEIRESLQIEKDTFLIGHIGSFSLAKNHEFIIDVFKRVREGIPNSKLILIGDGDLRGKIKNKVKELGLNEDVMFLGIRRDVNKLLMAMDLFVFPSLFEGLPVTLIEAQATGIECLISNNITKEVDLNLGLIKCLNIDDVNIWVNQINQFKKNINRKNIIEKIDTSYDIRATVEMLQNFYIDHYKKN